MTIQAPVQLAALKGVSPKKAVVAILGVSAAALALLVVIIYGHGGAANPPSWVSWLPALNAFLNGTSAVFLVRGYLLRRTNQAAHARNMITAFAASALFLVSYIVYHSVHGDTKFAGQGAIRPVYFFILISHIALSAVVLPLIFSSFFFALAGRFPRHKAISRFTFPVWLYVSITGVLVFVVLRAYA